jgi:ABC-type lipoprotein export system ATPase subunit/bifunctional DNA-binding transcriptional regulator/antitoxin component of YhaV-PrlF toxin-antitoxin module
MSQPYILCRDLVKIYKGDGLEVLALQGLDLEVEEGEFVGIVGASGSGKSTLLNILAGLDTPSAGKAIVGAYDLGKLSSHKAIEYRRKEVGIIWQQTARGLFPYLTAQQNVEAPLTFSGRAGPEGKKKSTWAAELLELVGLGDRRDHIVQQLSGGEQQRVAIAVALANQPRLLLADEPTGELDSASALSVYHALQEANHTTKVTIVLVTHDPEIASHVDRVVSIRDGRTSAEFVRRLEEITTSSEEEEQTSKAASPSTPSAAQDEFVLVDRFGRLQLPIEHAERLGLAGKISRVRVHLEDDHLTLWVAEEEPAGAGRKLAAWRAARQQNEESETGESQGK